MKTNEYNDRANKNNRAKSFGALCFSKVGEFECFEYKGDQILR